MYLSIIQIARNTFRETLRDPIFFILLLCSLILIGLLPECALFVFREQKKLVIDSSLATILSFGWIIAVLASAHTITREIDKGTISLILSKPVKRYSVILAKILGIFAALTVFVLLNSLAALIALRVAKDQFRLEYIALGIYFGTILLACFYGGVRNYLSGESFVMNSSLGLMYALPTITLLIAFIPVNGKLVYFASSLVPAMLLILFAVLIIGIIAISLSTCLNTVSNLLVCFIVFTSGLMSDYLVGRFANTNWIASILYGLIPNWQMFWLVDAITAGETIPIEYLLWASLYAIILIFVFTIFAVVLFQDREVGR
ncbi:MAG: ABC transporter permease subunit [Verrucomicrobiota bacterium]|nr:ABC transporter permease subunit [Verrucomicrobiota bacterium]